MNSRKGQVLRLIGLLIEVPCVLAFFYYQQGRLGDWSNSAVDPAVVFKVGIGVGFGFWLAGVLRGRWPSRATPGEEMS